MPAVVVDVVVMLPADGGEVVQVCEAVEFVPDDVMDVAVFEPGLATRDDTGGVQRS